jgi:hypothetical protein
MFPSLSRCCLLKFLTHNSRVTRLGTLSFVWMLKCRQNIRWVTTTESLFWNTSPLRRRDTLATSAPWHWNASSYTRIALNDVPTPTPISVLRLEVAVKPKHVGFQINFSCEMCALWVISFRRKATSSTRNGLSINFVYWGSAIWLWIVHYVYMLSAQLSLHPPLLPRRKQSLALSLHRNNRKRSLLRVLSISVDYYWSFWLTVDYYRLLLSFLFISTE